jgi:hypothetical protein
MDLEVHDVRFTRVTAVMTRAGARAIAASALAATVSAAAATQESPEPVWVAAWGSLREPKANITAMVTLPGDFRPGSEADSVDAEELARQLKMRPAGRRAILLSRYCHSFWGHRLDLVRTPDGGEFMGPWADDALATIAKDWPRILAVTKYCGGTLDLLVGDFEEHGRFSTWWMTDEQMHAVMKDPRWSRPSAGLEPLGATLRNLAGLTPAEIKDPKGPASKAWNLATFRLATAYINRALWLPAVEQFPGLVGSNYQGVRTIDRPSPDLNGHQQPGDCIFGNASSPSLYGEIGSITNLRIDAADPTRISWQGDRRLPRTAWTSLMLCQQQARSCVRGARDMPLIPWIANPSFAGDDPKNPVVGFVQDLRAYDENVRHVALLGVPTILWWRSGEASTASETDRVDQLVAEINRHALGRIKEPADVEPISFLSEVLVTGGRRHDGKWLWRVTASPEVAALREVGSGREWAPTADTLGFWVETAEKTAPKWEVARRRGPSEPSLARPVKPAPAP